MYASLGIDFLKREECAPCEYDAFLNRCDCSKDYAYKPPRNYDEVDLGPLPSGRSSSRGSSSPTVSSAGMAGGTVLLLGAAVIAGAYYFGKK